MVEQMITSTTPDRHQTVTRTCAVTVRAAPLLDPPYEDDHLPLDETAFLPLDWSGPDAGYERAAGPAAPDGANDPPAARVGQPDGGNDRARVGQPDGARPVTAWLAAQRYVGMCVEVLNGYRPLAHLRPITDGHRFADIADQLVRRAVRVRMSPGQAARQGRLVRARRMLVCQPCVGVAEAATVIEQGDRCWAMAIRLEHVAPAGTPAALGSRPLAGVGGVGGWRCTVVQVI